MLNPSAAHARLPRVVARARCLVYAGAIAGGAAAPAALVGCDPCAGVASCLQSPARLGISGEIVDRGDPSNLDRDPITGANIPEAKPVAGVRVQVTRVAGTIEAPQAEAVTDATGWWQVDVPATGQGGLTVDIVVTPPNGVPYQVRGLNLRTSQYRGVGNFLGRWTTQPFLTVLGEVFNAPGNERVVGARVTAVRRGGIDIAPTRNTQSPMLTGPDGRFLYDVRPLADGPLVLDLVIERPGFPQATVSNDTLYPQHEWLPAVVAPQLELRLDSAGKRVAP